MSVGQHNGDDVVEAVLDTGEVGQNQIDPGLVTFREEHTAVDYQQFPTELEDGHVAPDGAQTTKGEHPETIRWKGRGGG